MSMEPQERQRLDEILEIVQKNNKILHKMQNNMRWGRFFRIFYWTIIIGATIWGTYYLQPYLNKAFELYKNVNTQVQNIQNNLQDVSSVMQNTKR